jgi:ankyrin repeat protein
LLRQPKNREIIQKVIDDASTLRASRNSQGGPPTIVSHPESIIGGETFDMDVVIVNTQPYRRAMAHNKSKCGENGVKRSVSDTFSRAPPTIVTQPESTVIYDMGADIVNPTAYRQAMADSNPKHVGDKAQRSVSDSVPRPPRRIVQFEQRSDPDMAGIKESDEMHDQLSPMECFTSESWEKPRPYVPTDNHRFDSSPRRYISLGSDPATQRRFSFPIRERPQEIKKSLWGTITRKASRASQAHQSGSTAPISPALGSRRVKRRNELNIHKSIDFSTAEGLSAPAIVRAAQSGSRMEVERLLEQRMNIEQRHDGSGRTALAVASHCGNDHVVYILLRHGAKVDTSDTSCMTPLHLAASRSHYRVVELLLDYDADVDALGPDNKTPLRLASDNGHFEVVELLLQCRAKVNARDRYNSTALHAVAKIGDDAIASLLLGYGADIETKDGELMTALHHACEGGYDTIIELLLANNANIEALGKAAMTPLACACSAGSNQATNLLLQRKANVKHKGEGDMTPLHWASYNGHDEIVNMLLQKRIAIDARTSDGRTPLHLAVMTKNFAAAEILLRKGATIEARCNNSLRPIHYACKNSDATLVHLLLSHGAQMEAVDQHGQRPLHVATIQGAQLIVGMLLDKGALPESRNAAGDSALTLARTYGHLNIVRMLLDRGAPVHSKPMKGSSHEDSALCKAAQARSPRHYPQANQEWSMQLTTPPLCDVQWSSRESRGSLEERSHP